MSIQLLTKDLICRYCLSWNRQHEKRYKKELHIENKNDFESHQKERPRSKYKWRISSRDLSWNSASDHVLLMRKKRIFGCGFIGGLMCLRSLEKLIDFSKEGHYEWPFSLHPPPYYDHHFFVLKLSFYEGNRLIIIFTSKEEWSSFYVKTCHFSLQWN